MSAFRERLKERDLSQGRTAEWLGVTDRTVRRWADPDSGYPAPRGIVCLLALMQQFDLSPDEVDRIVEGT